MAFSSPRTLESNASEAVLNPQYAPVGITDGNLDMHPDLFLDMPLPDGSIPGFQDELELGTFFASEFEQWFKRFPT